jgi:hypothetical protein
MNLLHGGQRESRLPQIRVGIFALIRSVCSQCERVDRGRIFSFWPLFRFEPVWRLLSDLPPLAASERIIQPKDMKRRSVRHQSPGLVVPRLYPESRRCPTSVRG